jgi:hypothetical protein
VARAEGEDVPDELIAHLSPIAWESVNFLGQFTFEPGNARPLEDRRPLRSGADDSDDLSSRGFPRFRCWLPGTGTSLSSRATRSRC